MAYLPPVGPASFPVNRGTANDKLIGQRTEDRLIAARRGTFSP